MNDQLEQELNDIFDMFSEDGQNVKAAGVPPETYDFDREESKLVQRQEFFQYCLRQQEGGNEQAQKELLSAFRMFDLEQTGQISISSLRNILGNLGDRVDGYDIETIVALAEQIGENCQDGEIRFDYGYLTECVCRPEDF